MENQSVAQSSKRLLNSNSLTQKLDELKKLRGDLPDEVQDWRTKLRDTRLARRDTKLIRRTLKKGIKKYKEGIKEAEKLIKKYTEQQKKR